MRRIWLALAMVALAGLTAGPVSGQSGEPAVGEDDGSEVYSWLFVIDADDVSTADGTTLTIGGIEDHVLTFTDRPVRYVSHATIGDFVDAWDRLFAGDPPNAAITWSEGDERRDAAIELTQPRLEDTTLSLSYTMLEELPDRVAPLVGHGAEGLPPVMERVSLFIDDTSGGTVYLNEDVLICIYVVFC